MEIKLERPEYAGIRVIGIPRALHYYRYGKLWMDFFTLLGLECVLSEPTNKEILTNGINRAIDEACYSGKVYLGHVQSLIGRCDAIFVPRITGYAERKRYCTRFESLYDLVNNTFAGSGAKLITVSSDWRDGKAQKNAYIDLGVALGFSRSEAKKAYSGACKLTAHKVKELRRAQQALMKTSGTKVLLAAHTYIAHDPYVGGQIAQILKSLGCTVLYVDRTDTKDAVKRSQSLTKTMPWIESREIVGAIDLLKKDIDGVVVASAYPCSPDSMTDEFIMRTVKDIPVLQVTVDVQDGTAGLETRLESFIDIIRFRMKNDHGAV